MNTDASTGSETRPEELPYGYLIGVNYETTGYADSVSLIIENADMPGANPAGTRFKTVGPKKERRYGLAGRFIGCPDPRVSLKELREWVDTALKHHSEVPEQWHEAICDYALQEYGDVIAGFKSAGQPAPRPRHWSQGPAYPGGQPPNTASSRGRNHVR